MSERIIRVALIGQPNVGKSTVFNHLSGLNQHVGNWPGKTVEKKSGFLIYNGFRLEIVDLPGTYSLTSNSEEERIAREYIIKENPDVVIVLLNASSLERSLYLLSEIILLKKRVVVGINMVDIAERNGIKIDFETLKKKLKMEVVPLVASKNYGLRELIEKVIEVFSKDYEYDIPRIKEKHKKEFELVLNIVKERIKDNWDPLWFTIKLFEGDREVINLASEILQEDFEKVKEILSAHEDAYMDIVSSRYEWISEVIKDCVKNHKPQEITLTDKIDKYVTHPFYGFLIFLGVIFLMFFLTFLFAIPLIGILGKFITESIEFLKVEMIFLPNILKGILFDGVFRGVGMVLTLIPTLFFFFLFVGILEDFGYLSRIAYLTDNIMHKIGLHGKSVIPLFIGFGCNVLAVVGSRIIENKRAKIITVLMSPFIPCSARLSVLTFLVPIFFGKVSYFIIILFVLFNILASFIIGFLLFKYLLKGVHVPFIMELPLYHNPNFKTVLLYVYLNIKTFLEKAFYIIVLVSIIVYLLSYFPHGDIQKSYLSKFGKSLVSITKYAGLDDWRAVTALLTSFLAKENSVSSLSILYRDGDEDLLKKLSLKFPTPSAISFLIMQMLFIPCLATFATIFKELGLKFAIFSVFLHLTVTLFWGIVTFQILNLLL